jgi:cysteine desulfurase/selenocysteine lyase
MPSSGAAGARGSEAAGQLAALEEPRRPLESTGPRPRAPAALLNVRSDFPILATTVRGKPLVYLDNAATSQKPQVVIDAVSRFYSGENANIHRGVHFLSERATLAHDAVRAQVAGFVNAPSPREIVFTRGTTEAINLVAQSWGRNNLRAGDEILITVMEHHSNIVPWQLLCEQTGAVLRAVPVTDAGELDLDAFDPLLTERTRLLALTYVSNALGTINPVAELAARARARGAIVLVDGAQAAPHLTVDVQALGCDFFAFSSHKVFGPTGIGVLYGRESLLERMPPWQGGGDMIASVTLERSTWAPLPAKFEAGTPAIAQAIGLGAALDYVSALGLPAIAAWEAELLRQATERVSAIPGLRVIGTARQKASVLSFVLEGVHPHDVGAVLDDEGVAIRAGHHCAQPLMQRFGVSGTVRASFAFYNTLEDIDALVRGLHRVREVLG